ncbi:hypothetical protein O3M35_004371 [Rhynocoris fuscipes]|uniref:m7GpppN-mRNA hydrolase n=1 Tax=Rhynocoris fuscipes TaxID=488301 RepID=A0AAW1CGZ6_9HEMI
MNYINAACEIPTDILDDLCSRFIINVPEEERKDLIRLCFQIELAHWFYLDFYFRNKLKDKKCCGFREFAHQIFNHIPYLHPYLSNVERIIDEWKGYKLSVPTFGAILLDENMSHVLLVQSYYSKSSWGFPKGKINKDEPPCQCAIREVYEETGFNIENLIDPKEYIEAQVNEQLVRLYIVAGVSRAEIFAPKTRNEIRAVNWFPVTELPATKKDASFKLKTGYAVHSFFMVTPFVRRLRQWIFEHDKKLVKEFRRPRYKSCGDLDYYHYRDSVNFSFLSKVYVNIEKAAKVNKDRLEEIGNRKWMDKCGIENIVDRCKESISNSKHLSSFVIVPSSDNPHKLSTEQNSHIKTKFKPIPFNAITLSESFLRNGISAFCNFKLNWEPVLGTMT